MTAFDPRDSLGRLAMRHTACRGHGSDPTRPPTFADRVAAHGATFLPDCLAARLAPRHLLGGARPLAVFVLFLHLPLRLAGALVPALRRVQARNRTRAEDPPA